MGGPLWLSGGRLPGPGTGPEYRPVRIHADRDLPGRIAARALVRKLRETGREVEADGLYALDDDRIDAADVLAVEVGERASIREHDGGLSEDESLRKAWAASVGRATAREIKTLSQALEAMGKPKFTLDSRPLVLGTGKRNSRGGGGLF